MTERMTAKEYQEAQRTDTGQGEDRRRVRGTQRTTTADGITHDSKTEGPALGRAETDAKGR